MKKSTTLLLLVIAAFLGIVVLKSLPLFDVVQASPGRFDHVKPIGMITSGAVFLDSNTGKIWLYDLDDGKPRYLGQLIETGQRLGGHGEK